jgi:hypothetical protein
MKKVKIGGQEEMSRQELLMNIFKKHLFTMNDSRKNIPTRLKVFGLDEFWYAAPKKSLQRGASNDRRR